MFATIPACNRTQRNPAHDEEKNRRQRKGYQATICVLTDTTQAGVVKEGRGFMFCRSVVVRTISNRILGNEQKQKQLLICTYVYM